MTKIKNLEDLFIHELKDIYSAEKQLLEAMPKMIKETKDSQLKQSLESHMKETTGQIERLEKVFKELNIQAESTECLAMKGLLEETRKMLAEDASPEAQDAAIIATAQKVEHYEISAYGTCKHYAERLGHTAVVSLLDETLREEQNADTTLNDIAKSRINQKAERAR